jgi:hypothetical protein
MSGLPRRPSISSTDEKSANVSPISSHHVSRNQKEIDDFGEKPDAIDEDNASLSQRDEEIAANGQEVDVEAGEPVKKVTTKHSVSNVASIPNGGALAWMQVVGAFFLFFNTWYVHYFLNLVLFYPHQRRGWNAVWVSWVYLRSIDRVFQI